ncbi:hypothetical protein EKO27_g5688 [Xylaria grammica]|uniref:Uncharacterized protein n=1 Tax=Xylaria grammica TaxID=363999 RepID=A0A439D4S9_9PEZI|nr:hypothetical protein EKO27_g5688 [Xylaria grammica]
MSKWAWLSTSLAEKKGIFGQFHQCLTFESSIQRSNGLISLEGDVETYVDKVEKSEPDICVMYAASSFTYRKDIKNYRAFTNSTAANNGRTPLPISKALFDRVVTVFSISPSFLHVLNTGLAVFTSSIGSKGRGDDAAWEKAQFIIQQNRSYSAFSIALTFSMSTGKTRALIFGAEHWVVSNLFQSMASMPTYPYGPMVIPAVALELQAQWFNDTVRNLQDHIHSIETITGMRQFNFPHEVKGPSPQDWKTLDLISITRDLSSFLSRFAFLKLQAETGAYLVDRMIQTTELFVDKIEKNHREKEPINMSSDQNSVISKLEEVQSWYLGLKARCRYLSERASAQNQTVYCLIASQYNLTDIDIARASCNIAEETRKENEAMRAIAEITRRDNELMIQVATDSRTVAIATARDNSAMRVIAAVTILFLPATFTATFFSMTFFDFSDAAKPRVSPWTWIYVLVTATVTILIQSAWAIMSRKKKAKIIQRIPMLHASVAEERL